jgi:hypothetical protein
MRKENTVKLTIEEKSAVSRYLSEDMSLRSLMNSFWPWFVPLIGLALHGIFYGNVISSSLANVLFVFYAYWFLSEGSKQGQHIKSAIQKYEEEVAALGE